ncbi:MAG: NAD(P)H-quinone oxidoreductase, partial [Alphaproteobacteria bacterium]|nr:NAD(P)H-quinone oxidoreductase [Alphaproteobacteria bacterium]
DICKKLGADYVINYQKQDFAAIVAEHTDHQGVELIMDMVGGDYFAKNIDCLAMDGRLIEIAYLRGAKVEMNIDTIMNKRLTITGSKLRPLPMERKTRLANQLHRLLWPMLESGRVKPVVDKVFPFREAAAAHKYLESGQHVGKIILKF